MIGVVQQKPLSNTKVLTYWFSVYGFIEIL
jgi:hypothetical protein